MYTLVPSSHAKGDHSTARVIALIAIAVALIDTALLNALLLIFQVTVPLWLNIIALTTIACVCFTALALVQRTD